MLCGMEIGGKHSGTPDRAARDAPPFRELSVKIIDAQQLHMEQGVFLSRMEFRAAPFQRVARVLTPLNCIVGLVVSVPLVGRMLDQSLGEGWRHRAGGAHAQGAHSGEASEGL